MIEYSNTNQSPNYEERIFIAKILSTVNQVNKNANPKNKPHRNIIITSTFDMSSLRTELNKILDNFCYIDDGIHDISLLPQIFYEKRKKALNQNTFFDEDLIIALNINILHLSLSDMVKLKLITNEFGYRIIAFIWNPLDNILHWNSQIYQNSPEARISDKNLAEIWKTIQFKSPNKIERQSIIWNLYALLFWNLKKIIKIYTYEQVLYSNEQFIKDLCNYLLVPYPEVFHLNLPQNFISQNSEDISICIQKNCPTRLNYHYDNKNGIIPGIWDNDPVVFCRTVLKLK